MPGLYPHKRVQVEVGRTASPKVAAVPPGLVLFGVCPPEHGAVVERRPEWSVTRTRRHADEVYVEHLRVPAGAALDVLPGFEGRAPSRLRDSVALAFSAGAQRVDLVLVHGFGLGPGDVGDPRVAGLAEPLLEDLRGWILAYPDAGARMDRGVGAARPVAARMAQVVATVRHHAQGWRRRHQVGLVDLPEGADERSLDPFRGADLGVVSFAGRALPLRRQGWRCAAAALGGALVRPGTPVTAGIVGRRVRLGPGRSVEGDHRAALGLAVEAPPELRSPAGIVLALDDAGAEARIVSDDTLRRPAGEWPLPLLRSAKLVHLAILAAAEPFVFRPVDDAQAVALMAALDEVVRPFAQLGVLVGPDGVGPPVIQTDVVRDRAAPGLVAMVSAQLRPWCREVRLRVGVQYGGSARVESAA